MSAFTLRPMFRSRILSTTLLLVSLGIFMFPVLPSGSTCEELLEEGTEQSEGANELPKFDPAGTHVRSQVSIALTEASVVSYEAHGALPLQDHVAEVPVPPPEA